MLEKMNNLDIEAINSIRKNAISDREEVSDALNKSPIEKLNRIWQQLERYTEALEMHALAEARVYACKYMDPANLCIVDVHESLQMVHLAAEAMAVHMDIISTFHMDMLNGGYEAAADYHSEFKATISALKSIYAYLVSTIVTLAPNADMLLIEALMHTVDDLEAQNAE